MNSIKRLLAIMGTIVALMSLAPVASAGSHQDFHLDKTCGPDASEPLGFVCTIQHADFKWFPAGTKVHYTSANATGDVVQATIAIGNGSTDGECVWSGPVNAVCTFGPGTGRLSQFHLVVDVTANADVSIWYWDGTYWFGGGN
jgi:hypothetical protein